MENDYIKYAKDFKHKSYYEKIVPRDDSLFKEQYDGICDLMVVNSEKYFTNHTKLIDEKGNKTAYFFNGDIKLSMSYLDRSENEKKLKIKVSAKTGSLLNSIKTSLERRLS